MYEKQVKFISHFVSQTLVRTRAFKLLNALVVIYKLFYAVLSMTYLICLGGVVASVKAM